MNKVRNALIQLTSIKHLDNSRLRENDDVADLMNDISQHGLLEPVGIRVSDNALIYGNRRVTAFHKLGYHEIECILYDDVSDEDLLILNLVENIKRRNIGSIEIGRVCEVLISKGMSHLEIGARLGLPKSRVQSALSAYRVTRGTKFEKLVNYGRSGASKNGIPESLIWQIQNQLQRVFARNKISDSDWNLLLEAVSNGLLNSSNVSLLKNILIFNGRDVKKSISILNDAKVIYSYVIVNRDELERLKNRLKISNEIELIKQIIKDYDKDLLF